MTDTSSSSSSSAVPDPPAVWSAVQCTCGFPIGVVLVDFAERLAARPGGDRIDHQGNIPCYEHATATAAITQELLVAYGIQRSCCVQNMLCPFTLPAVS